MSNSLIKKPHLDDEYTDEELKHLVSSTADPIYFIENFIKVQHPLKGSIPLKLYPFQVDMIRGYHENRFVVALTSRQMGKSCYKGTIITHGSNKIKIGDLFAKTLTLRETIVEFLEMLSVKFARW